MLENLLKSYKLSNEQVNSLNKLRELCIDYNKHTNLTSITNEEEFNIKHILDSISILNFYDLNNKSILDVGSGGGFPGLVLAIVLPESKITMLDSNNKKIEYIKYAIKELSLKNAFVIYSRVEEANISEMFDVTLSRAVAPLNILLEIISFSVKINGKVILYKGLNINDELPKSWKSVKKLGLEFNEINDFNLDEKTIRKIIDFNKISKTEKQYPRDYQKIKSNPIY